MKANLLAKSLLIAGLTVPLIGFASNPADVSADAHATDQNVPVRDVMSYLQQQQAIRNKVDMAVASIKSRRDLQRYLAMTGLGDSPIDALSLAAKQRFLSSLVFTSRGLASFEYGDLESELTPTQIYGILNLFGVQHDAALMQNARVTTDLDREILMACGQVACIGGNDHIGYYCRSDEPHTCARNETDICTSNC